MPHGDAGERQPMERDRLVETLNGGYIEQFNLDLRRNALGLHVDVLEAGRLSTYELSFEKLSSLELQTDSRSDAGDRLQLTEMWIDLGPEESPTEEWAVTISIFDRTHVRLRCSSITIDGRGIR